MPCSTNAAADTLTCSLLHDVIGSLPESGSLGIELVADISIPKDATNVSLEATLADTGTPESLGSILWTDETGEFKWIEGTSPIARGTRWQ